MRLFTLTKVSADKHSAYYRVRTVQGASFDLIGTDLNTSRSHGAGPVWSWQVSQRAFRYGAKPVWTDAMHHFGSKAACIAHLEQHIIREGL